MAISLVNTKELWGLLQEHFGEVSLVKESRRVFTAEEYESLGDGLFSHLCNLRSSGVSDFSLEPGGSHFFRNLVIRAGKLRRL
jgi:hypothetical protein